MPPGGIGLGPLPKGGGGKGPGIEVGGLGGLPVGGAGGGPCGGGGGGAWGGGGNGLGGAPGAVVPLAAGGGGLFASGGFVLKYNCNVNIFESGSQWEKNLGVDLSISVLGTLKDIISYGSAANNRY